MLQGPHSFSLEQLLARLLQQLLHTRDQQLLISAQHRAQQKLALTKVFILLQVHGQLRAIKGLILHPTINQIWTSWTDQSLNPLESTRIHQILISLMTQFPLQHPGKRATRTKNLITQQDLISLTFLSQQDHTTPRNQLQLTADQLQFRVDQPQFRVIQLFQLRNQTIQLV